MYILPQSIHKIPVLSASSTFTSNNCDTVNIGYKAADCGRVVFKNTTDLSSAITYASDIYRIEGGKNGGAIYAKDVTTLNINGAKFNNLRANNGGAIYALGEKRDTSLNIYGAEFENNIVPVHKK